MIRMVDSLLIDLENLNERKAFDDRKSKYETNLNHWVMSQKISLVSSQFPVVLLLATLASSALKNNRTRHGTSNITNCYSLQ